MTELDRAAMAAIVIGASRPGDDLKVAERLTETAKELRFYLEKGFGLIPSDPPNRSRLCWLFDDTGAPHQQVDEVAAAVNDWAEEMRAGSAGPTAPLNLLLFVIGHAEQGGRHILLAESKYKEEKPRLDMDRLSSCLVSNAPLGSRYFVYLDCCYAGAVFDAMGFKPSFGQDEAGGQVPHVDRPFGVTRGIWGLIAANKALRAWAPPGDNLTRMSTLFFEALRATPRTFLSLDEIEGRMVDELKRRETTFESWRRLTTPQPYVQKKYEESLEQLNKAPLFPTGWRSDIPTFEFLPAADPSQMTVIVVTREAGSDKLVDAVKAALDGFETELSRQLGSKFSKPPLIGFLDAAYAFENAEELSKRLRALCKADLAVFDVTANENRQFEPGVMLLLGVRAVVRRGVTICSVDAEAGIVFDYVLPYNLMFVNLSSHDEPYVTAPKILRSKIASGFKELQENPSYLDLPAFDAVRELGSNLETYRPKPYDEGVLYLGPFERTFQSSCFVPLEQALKNTLNGLAKQRLGRNYTEKHEPHVRRLLDNDASKLVALSVYEAIRRYDFCLTDWSDLRPNVFFELGVRIASNENGAVHIVAETRRGKYDLHQLETLYNLFAPVVYRQGNYDARRDAIEKILERRSDRPSQERDKQLYLQIATECEAPEVRGVEGLIEELSRRANLAYVFDENDRSPSAAIYANDNLAIKNAVFTKSIGLKLAALFFEMGLEPRYEAVRDRLADLRQQVDQLERNGGREADVRAFRNGLDLLAGALGRSGASYIGRIAT
jgi:hypothetical protein